MGISKDTIKKYYQEYSKIINDNNISKDDFLDGLTTFIIDKLY